MRKIDEMEIKNLRARKEADQRLQECQNQIEIECEKNELRRCREELSLQQQGQQKQQQQQQQQQQQPQQLQQQQQQQQQKQQQTQQQQEQQQQQQ